MTPTASKPVIRLEDIPEIVNLFRILHHTLRNPSPAKIPEWRIALAIREHDPEHDPEHDTPASVRSHWEQVTKVHSAPLIRDAWTETENALTKFNIVESELTDEQKDRLIRFLDGPDTVTEQELADNPYTRFRVLREIDAIFRAIDPAESAGAPAAPAAGPFVFRRIGDIWELEFEGEKDQFADLVGFGFIASLLATPGKSISCLRLNGAGDLEPALRGTDQPDMDGESIRKIKERASKIEEELGDAKAFGQEGRQQELTEELEQLQQAKRHGNRPGGKRVGIDNKEAEKARSNVFGRFDTFYRKIETRMPKLHAHLKLSIRPDNYQYVYTPAVPIPEWKLS